MLRLLNLPLQSIHMYHIQIICSQCHPFFTGKQKFIDSAGRVEKFRKKYGTLQPQK